MSKRFIEIPHISLPGAVYFDTSTTHERFVLPPEARKIVMNCIRHFSDERYKLYAAVVMPDHIHALLQPLKKDDGEYVKLSSVMNVMKGYSSHKVKANLVTKWLDYPYVWTNAMD